MIMMAWWVVPATLGGFWLRYIPRHEWWVTALHIALATVAVGAAIYFSRAAATRLRGDPTQSFRWRRAWRDTRAYQLACVALVGGLFSVLSYGSINGVRDANQLSRPGLEATVRTWVPWGFDQLGYDVFANLQETAVSVRPADYWRISSDDRQEAVTGANLRFRDLRHANASDAFLQKADLRDADLRYANLENADLRDARLIRANLQDAILSDARLTGAWLYDVRNLTQRQLNEACGNPKTALPQGFTIPMCQPDDEQP